MSRKKRDQAETRALVKGLAGGALADLALTGGIGTGITVFGGLLSLFHNPNESAKKPRDGKR